MCYFIVTITMLISAPTQGVLKVTQDHFQTYVEANRFARNNMLLMGAGLQGSPLSKIKSVKIQETEKHKCH